ncbi:MAG: ROK family protein [Candidatus Aadella gelida]|nr:ROK family protein [Candidatus Aadella gelida]
MGKMNRDVRPFRVSPSNDEMRYNLKVFGVLKKEKNVSVNEISHKTGVPEEKVASYINSCVKEDLMKISGEHNGGLVEFNGEHKNVLGVGFQREKCYLNLLSLKGEVLGTEEIEIGQVPWSTAKSKDISAMLEKLESGKKGEYPNICLTGITLPENVSEKSSAVLSEGIKNIFKCAVCTGREPTPSGYIQKDLVTGPKERDILYIHSDRGAGVVFKGEEIFEASTKEDEGRKYLKPWEQFSVVANAKELVSKGLGTDMVAMAGGSVDNITLEIVLEAAGRKDELAEDLVKRASLALGVRIAYLVNMFKPEMVVLGGGIEGERSNFSRLTEESVNKFYVKGQAVAPEIVSGEKRKDVSSLGAASLCRREIFMEV